MYQMFNDNRTSKHIYTPTPSPPLLTGKVPMSKSTIIIIIMGSSRSSNNIINVNNDSRDTYYRGLWHETECHPTMINPRADSFAWWNAQLGPNVGYSSISGRSNSNDNRVPVIGSVLGFPRSGEQLPQVTSPEWGHSFHRTDPQVGEATSPGHFPRSGEQLP